MKSIKVILSFQVADHVTMEFIEKYFEKMMAEKIHNPVMMEIKEVELDFDVDDKL